MKDLLKITDSVERLKALDEKLIVTILKVMETKHITDFQY